MSLAKLTADAVRQAIAEFDRRGRDAFLSTYGFGQAPDYFLVHNGQPYDSKAIAGVAHQYLPGRIALKSDEFSGGDNAAAGRLRELGFDIKKVPTSSSLAYLLSSRAAFTIASVTFTTSMVANGKGKPDAGNSPVRICAEGVQ
jgi:5-methylcytosine-specific restriction protein A